MKNKITIFSAVLVLTVCLTTVFTNFALAQQTSGGNTGGGGQVSSGNTGSGVTPSATGHLNNPIQSDSITELFLAILDIILILAVPVIVLFIIIAGFNFVTANGDTTKISDARRGLMYALIGGVLILGARLILEVISNTINAF